MPMPPWRLLLVGGASEVVGRAPGVVGGASEVVGGASEVEGCPAGLVGKASSGRCSSGLVGGGGTVEETSDNSQYTMNHGSYTGPYVLSQQS